MIACIPSSLTSFGRSTLTAGSGMAKRPTPIERAIAGEPTDRMSRYLKRLGSRGLSRMTVTIPTERVDELRRLVDSWRADHHD